MLTRRQFLQGSLASLPAMAAVPHVFQRALFSADHERGVQHLPGPSRTLVVVQLKGGNDGLNTVVPYLDGRYYDARPGLSIPQDEVLPLGDGVGFHPALKKLLPLWEKGNLAVVEGVGYPNPSYSHFQSMDIWQSADPTGRLQDGWLGRYFSAMPPQESDWFDGLGIGRFSPPSLYTPNVAIPSVSSVDTYQLEGNPRESVGVEARVLALRNLYAAAPGVTPFGTFLSSTLEAAYQSSLTLQEAHRLYTPAVDYPDTQFGHVLQLLSEAISQGLGVRVGHVTQGGFDTHADQDDEHAQLLQTVAEGLAAFYADLQAHGKDGDVVIMTWSEFGRRVTANASIGTDHGAAAPMFILGTPVRGGLYGERPDLGNLDRGNLAYTTDFRSVYQTILEDWLQAPADIVLGMKGLPRIPLLNPTV